MSINYFINGVLINGIPFFVWGVIFCVMYLLQSFYKESLQKKGGKNVANTEVVILFSMTVAKYATAIVTLIMGVMLLVTVSPV